MYKEEAYYNNDGERVFSRSVQFTGRFNDTRGYSFYAFGKAINFRIQEYPAALTKPDIGNLVLLAQHLQLDTNALMYRSNKGKKPMDLERIGAVLGTRERQTHRFIQKMISLGIMKKVAVKNEAAKQIQYVMNPGYFLNGKFISHSLYWTFHKELEKVLPGWVHEKYRNEVGEE